MCAGPFDQLTLFLMTHTCRAGLHAWRQARRGVCSASPEEQSIRLYGVWKRPHLRAHGHGALSALVRGEGGVSVHHTGRVDAQGRA